MNKQATILVVDDERDLAQLIRYNLLNAGYKVVCAYDGASVIKMVDEHQPDMIILDLMLPDKSGLQICEELKRDTKIPILMLTARVAERDRIAGFESGADDYVTKPFSPRELVLRVKAMLARTQPENETGPADSVISIGILRIHTREYRVEITTPGAPAEELRLTPLEYQILCFLASNPNRVKTREHLLKAVWEEEADEVLDRTVDAHMKRLRMKLGPARDYLETVRGVGYRIRTPDTAA